MVHTKYIHIMKQTHTSIVHAHLGHYDYFYSILHCISVLKGKVLQSLVFLIVRHIISTILGSAQTVYLGGGLRCGKTEDGKGKNNHKDWGHSLLPQQKTLSEGKTVSSCSLRTWLCELAIIYFVNQRRS